MIGRRVAVGLSLLCALAFCAFAAQSAFAAKGTTAFTCAKVAGGSTGPFADAHCDAEVSTKDGYEHVAINGTTDKIELTNTKTKNNTTEHTPVVFSIPSLKGLEIEIVCTLVHGRASLSNIAGPPMNVTGSTELTFTECKMPKPGKGEPCKVKENMMTWSTLFKSSIISEKVGAEEMGLENTPNAGQPFTQITIEENVAGKCTVLGGAKGTTYNIEGTLLGTPGNAANGKGATLWFTKAMTEKTLKFGGTAASLEGVLTLAIYKEPKPPVTETENAIVLTTTAS